MDHCHKKSINEGQTWLLSFLASQGQEQPQQSDSSAELLISWYPTDGNSNPPFLLGEICWTVSHFFENNKAASKAVFRYEVSTPNGPKLEAY